MAKETANDLQEEPQATVHSFPYQDLATTHFASMLPCLEELVIRDECGLFEEREGSMVAAARPGRIAGTMALGKLCRVDVEISPEGSNQNARAIHLSAGLPSTRIVRATHMVDPGDKCTATHSNSTQSQSCFCIRAVPESLQRIIGSIAALLEFLYDFAPRDEVEPGKARHGACCSLRVTALVSLELTDYSGICGERIELGCFMGSPSRVALSDEDSRRL
ncbi:hypothetical protein HO173_013312 [Letharia columbiana]|uniref:Uncharacterized protein n=1 Tax=Letharia columbiana TaxID=112416 RepID=A0A8H6FCR7_9LECA|nr:uncharacterized protein HO173_013312 [Letharia columbiana]KAF6223099.1 hypothetical protein HO173_013312 [Letharia columbiana]